MLLADDLSGTGHPAILRAVWYGTTVASNSYASKQIILEALEKSGSPETIDFKLHDFGTRGVSSFESCVIGAMAHLVNFLGTDNVPALVGAMAYYDAPDVVGYSIPAMEHSTVTSWGRENEVEAYRNMLNNYAKPGAILACVSDAYDIFNCVENMWGGELRQQVIDSGAVVVVRPDSGDAVSVIEKCLRILDEKFGSTVNAKGYKVLNNVRIIQGDGIDHTTIRSILFSVMLAGYSADNIAFGQGGALLQAIDRDTLKFAMKCSAAFINGQWVDVYKDPITDAGKKSKKGRMILLDSYEGKFRTVTSADEEWDDVWDLDYLRPVFVDGEVMSPQSFADIRDRANGRVL